MATSTQDPFSGAIAYPRSDARASQALHPGVKMPSYAAPVAKEPAKVEYFANAGHVILERQTDTLTKSGLFLPKVDVKELIQRGTVVSIGPDVDLDAISFEEGDTVLYLKTHAIGPFDDELYTVGAQNVIATQVGTRSAE